MFVWGSGMYGDACDRDGTEYAECFLQAGRVRFKCAHGPYCWRADGFNFDLTLNVQGVSAGQSRDCCKREGMHTVPCGDGVEAELKAELVEGEPEAQQAFRQGVYVEVHHVDVTLDRLKGFGLSLRPQPHGAPAQSGEEPLEERVEVSR